MKKIRVNLDSSVLNFQFVLFVLKLFIYAVEIDIFTDSKTFGIFLFCVTKINILYYFETTINKLTTNKSVVQYNCKSELVPKFTLYCKELQFT